jgi:copper chaperone NosL
MFPEFSYMRTIVIVVIITGILVGWLRRKWLFAVWFGAFFTIAAFGIYDFWNWEYDYGHNLNPHAAIIVPGMSYQPPLIGCQQLLNFNACSFPTTGGIIIMAAGTICFLVFMYEILLNRKSVNAGRKRASKFAFLEL